MVRLVSQHKHTRFFLFEFKPELTDFFSATWGQRTQVVNIIMTWQVELPAGYVHLQYLYYCVITYELPLTFYLSLRISVATDKLHAGLSSDPLINWKISFSRDLLQKSVVQRSPWHSYIRKKTNYTHSQIKKNMCKSRYVKTGFLNVKSEYAASQVFWGGGCSLFLFFQVQCTAGTRTSNVKMSWNLTF